MRLSTEDLRHGWRHPRRLVRDVVASYFEHSFTADSATTREVLDLFDELHRQGMTILMVTHEADVAARAERVLQFQDGRIAGEQGERLRVL